jgi:DNA-binding PadR family transcriptional regulator
MTEMLIIGKVHILYTRELCQFVPGPSTLETPRHAGKEDERMISDGGSMDIVIMSQLYREPVGENELRANMRSWDWSDIMTTLKQLMRRALVVDINKDRTGHLYKLTREGERLVEHLIGKMIESRTIGA